MAFRTKKISQMDPKGSNLASTDLLEISELVSGSYVTKSITGAEIVASVPPTTVEWGDIGGTLSAQTDLNTALSGKQDDITLTTTGTSGASTFVANTLNVPTYSLSGLGGVPTSRTLTINGTTQDLSADRTFTISTGITIGTTAITSGTVGRVLFEGTGNVVQESANLFWDNTNGRLGIGTSTPSVAFHVSTSANTTAIFQQSGRPNITFLNGATSIGVVGGAVAVSGGAINDFGIGTNGTTNNLVFATGAGYSERLRINGSTGNVLINTTTDAGFKLDVNGTARVQTSLVINGSSSLFSSALTIYQNASNRIGSLSLSTNKADTTTRTHLSLNSSETSTPQSLDFQYIGATLINDRYNLLQTSEVGVAYGGGLVLQRDGGWVGIGSGTQFASAILAVTSTTRGFLPPRMTTIQKNAIATPATGLMVYDTTLNLISVYNGTTWITL